MTCNIAKNTKLSIFFALLLLWAGIFLFYLVTLAPTILWGDNAHFQRSAFEGILKRDGGGHWLWLQFARFFAGLPVGSIAYRVNLLSAVAAAVTLIFLSCAMRALGLSWTSAIVACVCLAVSHTFWMHAVRAEVYTVFTAILALQLWLWLSWRPRKPWPVYLAASLFGVTLLGHQMAVLFIPTALFLLWKQRNWFSKRDRFAFLGLFVIGLLPFIGVVSWQTKGDDLLNSLRLYFTRVDVDFTQAMFDFSLSRLPRDFVIWLGLLGLQFVGPAGLLGIYGFFGNTLKLNSWLSLLIFYATSVFFAFSYRVNDQFVFYIPSYMAFSFFIANGWQRIQAITLPKSRIARITALLLIIILPVSVYFVFPRLLAISHINPLNIRTLPGREPNQYFLWPASSEDYSAEVYARTALEGLAPNSAIIADHTPLEPLRYLQTIEGIRQDVQLIKIEPGDDLEPVIRGLALGKAIYIADNNPDYYNLTSLVQVCIKPFDNIYQLLLVPDTGCIAVP